MNVLLVDNHDSFTYNLAQLAKAAGLQRGQLDIVANDRIDLEVIDFYDKIIISPGPGIPREAGLLLPLIKRYAATKPILGICLGCQAIAEAFGAALINTGRVYHGVSSKISLLRRHYLFEGLTVGFDAGRYHSWVVAHENLPDCLEIVAVDDESQIMALSHRECNVHGLQFHPESILTPEGGRILDNFLTG